MNRQPPGRYSRNFILGLFVILLITLGTRLWVADSGDLNYDEAFMFDAASRPGINEMLGYLGQIEFHPPLSYILLHWWIPLAGKSEFLLRLLPLAFNVLTVLLTLALTLSIAGPGPGLLAGLLMALSPFQLQYGCELRMYSQLQFFVLAGGFCAWKWFRADFGFSTGASRTWLILAWAAFAGALYSHYYAVFSLLATAFFILAQSRAQTGSMVRALKNAFLLCALPSLLFLPWITGAFRAAGDKWPSVMPEFSFLSIPRFMQKMIAGNFYTRFADFPLSRIVVYTLLILGFTALVRRCLGKEEGLSPESPRLLLIHLLVPLLCQYLFALKFGTFIPKYAIPAAPFVSIVTGLGIWYLGRSLLSFLSRIRGEGGETGSEFLSITLVFLLLFGSVWPFFKTQMDFCRTGWSQVGRVLTRDWRSGDLCLVSLPGRTVNLSFYAPGVDNMQGVLAQDMETVCSGIMNQASRVWLVLVQSRVKDPDDLILKTLEGRLLRKGEFRASDNSGIDIHVLLYEGNKPTHEPFIDR